MDTAQAVPCWILPEWRVAEQLPPDLAAFDLVIIDEASQSDITAFPAIMRGKKVLILNAWGHWFVRRNGQLVTVADIRSVVRTRAKRGSLRSELGSEELDI